MTYEMTKPTMTKPARLMLTLCAAALLGVAPFHLSLDPSTGLIGVSSAMAQASGSDDNGSDSSNDGDSSGSDSDSNGDSDNSGRGNSDDDSDDSSDDHGRGHHSSSDDSGHHSSGDDSLPGGGSAGDDSLPGGGSTNGGLVVVKFESNRQAMEVVYSDGTKEEIFNSRYERKNAQGRTVEERPATQADVDRLWALR